MDAAKSEENAEIAETDPMQLKWPPKPDFSGSDFFESEDSWYDSPPEGFNLTVSWPCCKGFHHFLLDIILLALYHFICL